MKGSSSTKRNRIYFWSLLTGNKTKPTNSTNTNQHNSDDAHTPTQLKRAILSTVAAITLLGLYPSLQNHTARADAPSITEKEQDFQPVKSKKESAPVIRTNKNTNKFGELYIRPSGGLVIGQGGVGWGVGLYFGYQFLEQLDKKYSYNYSGGKANGHGAKRPQQPLTASNHGWQVELGVAYQDFSINRSGRMGDENFFLHFIPDDDSGLATLEKQFPNFRTLLPNSSDPLPFIYTFNGTTDTGSKTVIFLTRNGRDAYIKFAGLPQHANDVSEFTYIVSGGKFVLVNSNDPTRTPIDIATLIPNLLRGAYNGYDKTHFEMNTSTQQQLVPITINTGYRLALGNDHGFYVTPRLGVGLLFNKLTTHATLLRLYENNPQYDYGVTNTQSAQQWAGLVNFNTNLDYQLTPYLGLSIAAGLNYLPLGYITTPSFEGFIANLKEKQKLLSNVTSPSVERFSDALIDARDFSPLAKEKRSYFYGGIDMALQLSF